MSSYIVDTSPPPASPDKFESLPTRTRLWIIAFCFGATFFSYSLRIILAVAIIPMGEHFGWSEAQRGTILSSFFYGYVLSQIPGGILVKKFGPKKMLGWGVFLSASATGIYTVILNMLPPSSHDSSSLYYLFILCRVLSGLSVGVVYPTIHAILAAWLPAKELSRYGSLAHSGSTFGAVFCLEASSYLIENHGWPSVFQFVGFIGMVWCTLWYLKGADSPLSHPSISKQEIEYIRGDEDTFKENHREVPFGQIPWRKFFTHKAVWAIIVAHFCHNWGYYLLLNWLPTYFLSAYKVNLHQSALLTIFPHALMFVSVNATGWIADWMISPQFGASTTWMRKFMQSVGFLGPTFCFISLCAAPYLGFEGNISFAMLFVCLCFIFIGFSHSGYAVNHLDISPTYASILVGITNSVGSTPGVIGVVITGHLLEAYGGNWTPIFGLSIFWYLFGFVVYWFFGSGELIDF